MNNCYHIFFAAWAHFDPFYLVFYPLVSDVCFFPAQLNQIKWFSIFCWKQKCVCVVRLLSRFLLAQCVVVAAEFGGEEGIHLTYGSALRKKVGEHENLRLLFTF